MDNGRSKRGNDIEAQIFLDFYIELLDKTKNLFKYHLAEDVVLDWFGQTIKGPKNVSSFIKTKINPMKHLFREARSTDKIGFRDTHKLTSFQPSRRILRSTFISPTRETLTVTPIKQPQASTSAKRHINKPNFNGLKSPMKSVIEEDFSDLPKKRQKLVLGDSSQSGDVDVLEGENESSDMNLRFLTTEGYVEFYRSSLKKLQKETKWQRPCKLHIAYDYVKDVKDSSIYLIIYEGNMKCRRNLMREFEAKEPEN